MKTLNQYDWETLLEKAVDGLITEEDVKQLNYILKSDPSRLDDYIRFVDMHASLYQEPLLASTGRNDTLIDYGSFESAAKAVKSGRFWKALAFVTSTAALVAFTLDVWQSTPNLNVEREQYLGIITRLQADKEYSGLYVGKGLQRGQFALESGSAQLRLDNGVELSVRGPTEFEVHGLDHISLITGRVTANVPPQAIGFRIDTPDMEVIDLGTEFALKVSSTGESKLHVLEGEVEARLKEGIGYEQLPLVIAKGQINDLSQNVSYLEKEYDPSSFAPSPLRDPLIRLTGGMVHSLQEAPADLRNGRFKHDYLMLFPERRNFVLPEPLNVNLSEPGTYRILNGKEMSRYAEKASEKQKSREIVVDSSIVQSQIPSSTVVNSYLVHFDAFDQTGNIQKAKGRVRFNNRVLGVIVNGSDLNASDRILGSPNTIYESSHWRKTENDLVRISSDGYQVFLDFGVSGFIDQVRILVEADPNELEIARFLNEE